MKLLLLYPSEENVIDTKLPDVLERGTGIVPPLGLLYIAASVKRWTDWDVEFVDCVAERLNYGQIQERIKRSKPDAVGITAMTHSLIDCLRTARLTKKINPLIKVIFGGPHVHLYPKETIGFNCVDYVVLGEGEYTIAKLLNLWNDEDSLKEIKGFCFKTKKGDVVCNTSSNLIEKLDDIPHPDRAMIKNKRYFSSVLGSGITTMISSRGCPYKCTFCDRPHLGKNFRSRSAGDIVDEMEECIKAGAVKIMFYDDTFNVDRKRVFEVCREIKQRGVKVIWSIRARIDCVDLEMLKALKSAGCKMINYGVESGNDRVRRRLGKNIAKEKIRSVFKLSKNTGIHTAAYFMFGCPGEMLPDMLETIKFAKQLNPEYCHFTILIPFPGTPLYEEGMFSGRFPHDHWREFALNPVDGFKPKSWIETVQMNEIQKVLKTAYKEFYIRPSYFFKSLRTVRSLNELKLKFQVGMDILQLK
ncbi:MAG: cobalamin-dependent protein [Candidatus Omnitrophica bacterium]|nr:cobalamin-dependent protein [Candidatus Omnitrophota bacterium]